MQILIRIAWQEGGHSFSSCNFVVILSKGALYDINKQNSDYNLT